MTELTLDCFPEVCGAAPVRDQLGSLDEKRRAAVRRFFLISAASLVLAAAGGWALASAGWPTAAFFAAILVATFGTIIGYTGLAGVGQGLKQPVLETIAARAGLEYTASGFDPPVYSLARPALFGNWLSSETFSDLFQGSDDSGRRHAVYEALLTRRSGRNVQTVFSGQVYALERRPGARGTTVIVPDRGIFNFFKPQSGMERVKVDSVEPEFEKKFEVYSTEPLEAKQLLLDPLFRRRLLDWRSQGRIFGWFGPDEALLAVRGRNRFEPGSMFRGRPGEERVRAMLGDVCDALAILRDLKARLG